MLDGTRLYIVFCSTPHKCVLFLLCLAVKYFFSCGFVTLTAAGASPPAHSFQPGGQGHHPRYL